ncbi:STAS domain-containing protein [uncultured Xylophilus sp.]|uniref:STAS domain-containing protein n=1 Tax=uncultured Xylophilus sp. TaxID=296832 RepID=UPI0025DC177F|nr:STAS domain-containing protein [uncultured Xylophilus sp.]
MNGKDDARGLFGRMVRFVRNPLADPDADLPTEPPPDSTHGRQLLRELMERRRRNDFVRRREFDQLRRIRRSGAGVAAPGEGETRLSLFDSGFSTRSGNRALTLQKIDEIEEQMSQQWWKNRPTRRTERAALAPRPSPPSVLPPLPDPSPDKPLPPAGPASVPAPPTTAFHDPAPSFAPTAYEEVPAPPAHVAETVLDLELPDAATTLTGSEPTLPPDGADDRLRGFVHPPTMEEAAIQFANAEAEAAEQSLCGLIDGGADDQEGVWLALFDLYRASGRPDRFEAAAIAFAERFGRSPPAWFALMEPGAAIALPAAAPVPQGAQEDHHWRCPTALGAEALVPLERATAAPSAVWWLDWSGLVAIAPGAALPLQALLARWSVQPIALRFVAADTLLAVLQAATPPGDPQVDPALWTLRMEALRLLGEPETFDAVALDYCITYEVSPPSWHAVACDCRAVAAGMAPEPSAAVQAAARAGADPRAGGFAVDAPPMEGRPLQLAGVIAGAEMADVLARIDRAIAQLPPAAPLVLDCEALVRVDFAAAGTLLGWASTWEADGRPVRFERLHRLVAAFFNVVGIGECALVLARED